MVSIRSSQQSNLLNSILPKSTSPPKNGFQDAFTSALEAVGVDESKVAEILKQVREKVAELSSSGNGSAPQDILKTAINSVLDQNGVDKTAFQQAFDSALPLPPQPTGGAAGPIGPRPNKRPDFGTALEDVGVAQDDISKILEDIQGAIQSVRKSASGGRTDIRSIVNNVLQQNGVDTSKFEEVLRSQWTRQGVLFDATA